ncbi:putative disease resistance protein [Capsicum chacoense]
MAGKTEEYLLNKLDGALKQAQESEDCLSKILFDIQTHFKNVNSLLRKAKNDDHTDAGESSRRGMLYYLLNALAKWQMLLERKRVYSPERIRFAVALNRELKTMESRLKGEKPPIGIFGVAEVGSSERESDDGQSKSHDRWSNRTVDRSRVFGFNEKENFMERFLIRRDNEVKGFKAIGIYGVAGVGKTTLCQLTFNNEQVTNDFFPRIWVCMSKSPEDVVDYREEVVRRMLKCLGVEDEEMDFTSKHRRLPGLLFALRRVLKGRRYLIVLDDAFYIHNFFDNLWSEPKLEDNCTEKLALGLPKQQGGAVIVTTRSEELAKEMVGEENVHPLLPLQDKSCREIFEDSAGEKVKQLLKDQTDHDLEDTIMSKLGGLPLAAKIMGKIMEQELDKQFN